MPSTSNTTNAPSIGRSPPGGAELHERQNAGPPLAKDSEEASSSDSSNKTNRNWRQRLIHFGFNNRAPALLLSLIVHTAIFLILALWTVVGQVGLADRFDFQAAFAKEAEEAATAELVLASSDAPPPPSPQQASDIEPPQASDAGGSAELSKLLTVDETNREHAVALGQLERLFDASGTSLSAAFASTGVDGRRPEKRRELALARGGTLESEQAVEAALDWLAAHQTPSGAWSLIHDGGICNGRCGNNGSKDRFDAAATGLSLLAFLGAGYTHQEGKHRETVDRGIYFLLQILEETPQGGSFLYQSDRGMYNHGIAAFALCEAYQLTGDKDLKRPAQQAVDFIVSAQSYLGGWGYLPKKPGDLTLTGWQVMALKSAASAGLEVPPSTILRIDAFLDSQMVESGFTYGYREPGASPTCTAIGILLRMFRGMSHTDPRIIDGVTFLEKQGPSPGDVYFNYYASLTLFHFGGEFWELWHPRVREQLVKTQETQGHEAGSWFFQNSYGREGGRLYTTAMAAMTLEVYYRFSPLYQNADVPFEL